MIALLAVSLGVVLYVFAGYPLLLGAIARLRGPRHVARLDITPPVSLVISAWNEAGVIGAKIDNALTLDYPAGLLEIVVVSDASDDGTDEVVRRYAGPGVRLVRQEHRLGKTAGLNLAMPLLRGDIVVFSDANTMYEPQAVRRLVRNFGDPEVGCVTGEAQYVKGRQSAAEVGESAYWNYEILIKRLETQVGSMVGGDGAIYAIRRHLWQPLPENAINDFLNPLQIVAAGWRNVYEPEAVAHEETAGEVQREYRRRVRIVSRSWRAVFQAPQVLNPFRVGLFTLSVVSHKILRWFTGLFLLTAALAGTGVVWRTPALHFPAAVAAVAAVVGLAFPPGRRLAELLWYFVAVNAASLVGLWRGTVGRVSGVWSTPRQAGTPRQRGSRWAWVLTWVGVLCVCLAVMLWALQNRVLLVHVAFWGAVLVLVYIYAGYPVIMWVWRRLAPRPVTVADVTPRACLFVTAYNEATVIRQKLENSLALDYPRGRLEIVVASDGSTDGTNEIAAGFATQGIRLVAFPERRGKIAAINRGVPSVDAEIVVFSDANTFLEPGALRALARRFADPAVGAVSGDVVLVGDRAALGRSEDLYYKYERWLQSAESEVGSMVGADGALYAIRRALFVPPANDTILDDMLIPVGVVRQGFRAVFEPSAQAYEQGSRSALEEFSRKSRVVAGAVQFTSRLRELVPWGNTQFLFSLVSHKLLRWLSPWFAVAAFVTALGLATTTSTFMAIAAVQAASIVAGLLGTVEGLRRIAPIGIAHYFWLVQTAALVGLMRGLLGRQPAAWRRFEHVPVQDGPAPAGPGEAR